MWSECVYLEDARETLPHAAIQVARSKRVGIPDLPLLEASIHSCKRHATVDCLLLIDVGRITGKACRIEPDRRPAARGRWGLVEDRPYECTDLPRSAATRGRTL